MTSRVGLLFLLLSVSVLLVACSSRNEDQVSAGASGEVKKVTFMAGFKAQANLPFVGAYVAQENGYFEAQGLEVDIRHAQSGEHLQLLLAGEVQFTTANAAQVVQRNDQGLPVISIALVGQKSEQGYAVLANSGINTVRDWAGKTFGYKGTEPAEFFALARAAGLDPERVNRVRVSFDPRILSEGQVDILAVFFSNEPDTLARLGHPTRVFDPNDYGVQSMGLAYVASRDYLVKDPEAVQRFLKAVLKGIDYANHNREEALEIVMKFAPQEEREHQRFMLSTELDRAASDLTKRNGFGWQTREQWQGLSDTLLEYKTIAKPADLAAIFTDEYIKQIYRDGKLIWP